MTEQGAAPRRTISDTADQALLHQLPERSDAAFGELFQTHAPAVRRLALGMARDSSEADDITAETFFRVLQAIKRGAGPHDNVRAYLLTVARRVCWEWHGARRDVPVSDDELVYRAGMGGDGLPRTAEHSLITTAFSSLPERWRTVLWQTEVEGAQPAVVASSFGLSPNATAALARRARQGLRAAYLQAHLAVNRSPGGCRTVVEKLGGYTAGSVGGAEARRIKMHLLRCSSCRSTHAELRDVCSSLRAQAGAAVLLVPAVAVGMGAGSAPGVSTAAVSGAASSTAGSTAGAGSWLGTTVKGVLLGTKAKVGMALASTAAAGVFGVGVPAVVTDSDSTTTLGLPGHRGAELAIAPPPEAGGVTPQPGGATQPPVGNAQTEIAPEPGQAGYQPARQQARVPGAGHSAVPPEEPAAGAVQSEPVRSHGDHSPSMREPSPPASTSRDGTQPETPIDAPTETSGDNPAQAANTARSTSRTSASTESEQPHLSTSSPDESSRDSATDPSRESARESEPASVSERTDRSTDRSSARSGELERYGSHTSGDTGSDTPTDATTDTATDTTDRSRSADEPEQQPTLTIVIDGRLVGSLLGR